MVLCGGEVGISRVGRALPELLTRGRSIVAVPFRWDPGLKLGLSERGGSVFPFLSRYDEAGNDGGPMLPGLEEDCADEGGLPEATAILAL